MLFLRITLIWSAGSVPAASFADVESSTSSGSASASASSVVTSFLLGLRLRCFVVSVLVTFEINCACLIRRLSFFEFAKSGSDCTDFVTGLFVFSMDLLGAVFLSGRGLSGAILSLMVFALGIAADKSLNCCDQNFRHLRMLCARHQLICFSGSAELKRWPSHQPSPSFECGQDLLGTLNQELKVFTSTSCIWQGM